MSSDSASLLSLPVDQFISVCENIGFIVDPLFRPIENVVGGAFTALFPSIPQLLFENQSPLSKRLPLMNPFHVILFIVGYLGMVFFGKRIMASRQKMTVKGLSIIHNFSLVTLSAYMCFTILSEAFYRGYGLFGNAHDTSEEGFQMAKYLWLFYVSKITEFTDTLIMVLKKNNHQISFLHVYHHCSVFIVWWFVIFIAPNGEAYFSGALNSAVHVVMYGYYLSTTLSVPIRFIKRYITLLQMMQFVLNMIQATYDMVLLKVLRPTTKETFPFALTVVLWVYMWTMLGLFANFFAADRRRERVAKEASKKVQ